MSIYVGPIFEISVYAGHPIHRQRYDIFGMAVPGHIGYPDDYPDGDPFVDFLPPVCTKERYEQEGYRAIVIAEERRRRQEKQHYVDAILTISGEEFDHLSFMEVLARTIAALKGRK